MSQSSLLSDWTKKFTDPYAILGVSVAADDRRVLKRYRDIAKLLHPDRYALKSGPEKELATQLFARLVNPAYEQLKQEKGRIETSALLKINVRRLCREQSLAPKSAIARNLMEHPASGVDVFYEKSVSQLAETQYQSFDEFATITEQLGELNLVYLQLKMGEVVVREKRTGLIAATQASPLQFTPAPANAQAATESYDQRHYRRAQEYAKKGAWSQVIQELRDAIKIKATKSEYHALLGVAYLYQPKLLGMAKVHLKRALELNPHDTLALKYAPKVGLPTSTTQTNLANGKHPQNGKQSDKTQKAPPVTQQQGLWGFLRGKSSNQQQSTNGKRAEVNQAQTNGKHANGTQKTGKAAKRKGFFGLFWGK